jgi:hypothetical protein
MEKGNLSPDGPILGILRLDCEPFDIPGLIACNDTFPFARRCKVVKGATVEKMTSGCQELVDPILKAARELEGEGAAAIMGECGFMSLFQKPLQESVNVPVFTSSLLLVPLVYKMIPPSQRIGIITFRSDSLGEAHFQGSGWSSNDIPITVYGVEDQSAWQLILTPEHPYHGNDLERQLMDVCKRLVRKNKDLGAIVLECAIMPVWAHNIQAETGLPVFDITTLANLVYESFSRKPFLRKQA